MHKRNDGNAVKLLAAALAFGSLVIGGCVIWSTQRFGGDRPVSTPSTTQSEPDAGEYGITTWNGHQCITSNDELYCNLSDSPDAGLSDYIYVGRK